jgi:uncharacterized protein (TIGR03643 family)
MVEEKLNSENNLPTVIKNYVSDSVDIIDEDKDRIIQMAWEDRTPFEAIEFQFGLKEKDVIEFMRKNSLPSSFKMWRKRMKSRKTKHSFLCEKSINRFKCSRQRNSGNKIAKR